MLVWNILSNLAAVCKVYGGGVGGEGGGVNVKVRLLSCFFGRKFLEHPGLFCGGSRVGSFLVSTQCTCQMSCWVFGGVG